MWLGPQVGNRKGNQNPVQGFPSKTCWMQVVFPMNYLLFILLLFAISITKLVPAAFVLTITLTLRLLLILVLHVLCAPGAAGFAQELR